jgi:hypothetical protein
MKNFQHFFDIPKKETFMFIILKNQRCIYILSVLFCGKTDARCTLCGRYTLCAGRPSLVANLGLPEDFSQNMFPKTPTGNGNGGWGTRALSESSFKVGENSLPAKFCENKKISFFDMLILNFKSLKHPIFKESSISLSSHYHL